VGNVLCPLGLLTILRLTFHLCWFYLTRNPHLTFTLYTDSESLLKRLAKSLALTYLVPQRTLFSEADIVLQILAALDAFHPRPRLLHVEGHQDTKYPDRPLSWAARLNKCADEVATLHLANAKDVLPTTSVFPACKATLTIATTMITHHIPSQIRYFAGHTAHRAYLCKHHQWQPSTFDLIEWPRLNACSLAIPFLARLFLIKWTNDLLPFQHQQHKFNQSPSASCLSSCGCSDEDWRHFLRFPHPHRRQSWADFRKTLSPLFERNNIDPWLRRILLFCLFSVTEPDEPQPLLDHLPASHLALLEVQTEIGPDSLFFGFFTTDWIPLQDQYLRFRNLPRDRHQAASGIQALLTVILFQVHLTWLLRNEHLHGTDPLQQGSYKRLHLLAQLRELYDSAPLMLAGDRDILVLFSFERRQAQSTATLRAFYKWAKPLVNNSIHDANELGSRFRQIDSYFRPTVPPKLFDVILI
jgi:hypothetical protein